MNCRHPISVNTPLTTRMRHLAWLVALVCQTAVVVPAVAEDALPVLTVSAASKQEQALETAPASITVLDAEILETAGMSGLDSVAQLAPGLSFQPFGQTGVHAAVMRGISANFFSYSTSTLLLVDGVPTLMAQGFDTSLLGVERIEVLRGPQGTLYGRNAEAGVIAVSSRQPGNEPYSLVSAELGSRNKHALAMELSRALVPDTLYAAISAEWQRQDGFITNRSSGARVDDRESSNVRLALRWTPSARTDATLRLNHLEYDDGGNLWGSPSAARATVASGTPSYNRSQGTTLSLNVSHELGDGLKLRSVTAYNQFDDRVQQDTDFLAPDNLHIARDHRFRNLSQELRLEGRSRLGNWLLGLYADQDRHSLINEQKLPLALTRSYANQDGHSSALFGEWSLPLGERWTLVAGARAERDVVNFTPAGAASRSASWQRLSPKLALQYHLSDDSQLYVSATDGFRAGGFNVFVPATNYSSYQPEAVRAYELGTKGWLLEKRLRYSAALYWMDISNMQVQQMPTAGVVYITNAASGTSRGAEFELDYLFASRWQLQAGLALNRTRFDRFRDGSNVYDGNRNPFAPDINGRLSLRYDDPANWYALATLTGTGKVYLDAANRYSRNGYGLVNLAGGYRFGQVELSAYVNNLADRRYDAVGYQNGIVTVYSPPREAGLRLTWRM